MDVKLKFSKKDEHIAGLAKELKDAKYKPSISRPFHGSIPIMWLDEACYTGPEAIAKAVAELLGQK